MKIVALTQTYKLPEKCAEQTAVVIYIMGNAPDTYNQLRYRVSIAQTGSVYLYLQQNYVVFEVNPRDLQLPIFHFVAQQIILCILRAKNAYVFVFNDQDLKRVGYFLWQMQFLKMQYKSLKPSPFYSQLQQMLSFSIPNPVYIFVSIYRIAPLCYHTAVDFGYFELSFGKAKNADEGCYFVVSRQNTAYRFLRYQFVGLCHKTPDQLAKILEKHEREWRSRDYKLITHNCNDFCVQLLKALDLSCMLVEVTRLSSFARKLIRG